jgi:hypothetical protein
MDLETLDRTAAIDVMRLTAQRPDVFDLLWLRRASLAAVINAALLHFIDAASPEHGAAKAFLTRTLAHLRSANELVSLCESLDDEGRGNLLGAATKLYGLDPRVIVTLLDDATLLERLAPGAMWCSDALWVRATWLFEEHPARRFTIAELVPPHLPDGVRARAVLGAALDGRRLTDESVVQLRAMYPNDAYIQHKTTKLNTG